MIGKRGSLTCSNLNGIGGGEIEILDEGISVSTNVNKINFIGTEVNSLLQPDGTVNVYIPSALLSPYYNTSTAIVNDIPTSNRYVSNPTSNTNPFSIGNWLPDTIQKCINNNLLLYENEDYCSFADLLTNIEANIFDSDNLTLIAQHITSPITSNIDITLNNIRIQVTGFISEGAKYKGIIKVTYDLNSLLNQGGRFSIQIIHHDSIEGSFTKTQNNIFYDNELYTQDISDITIVEDTLSSTKYLSGLRYYTIGDSFNIGITDFDYANSNSYPLNLISVESDLYGITNFNITKTDLTNWNYQFDDLDDSYLDSKVIDIVDYRYIGTAAKIYGQAQDWIPGEIVVSTDSSICIDTYGIYSNELSEYLIDEQFRVTSTLVPWNSTSHLDSYDDNKGAMVINGGLYADIFAYKDWKAFHPGTSLNPDYSLMSGYATYYRQFIDIAYKVRGSSNVTISGFNLNDLISERIQMWIFIPDRFQNWCHVHGPNLFNYSLFNGGAPSSEPDKAWAMRLYNSITNKIYISFGTYGLQPLHNIFYMKIIINDNTIIPKSFVFSFT